MSKNDSSYKARISKNKEQKDAEAVLHDVESAQIQLTTDIFAAKTAMQKAKRAFEAAKGNVPFDSKAVLEAGYAAEDAEENYNNLLAVQEELFGTKVG